MVNQPQTMRRKETKMKEMFNNPKIELVKFSCEDVLTTSGIPETTTQRNDGPIELPDLEV